MRRIARALLGLALDSARRLRSVRGPGGAFAVLYVGLLQAAIVLPLLATLVVAYGVGLLGEALETFGRSTFAACDALVGRFGAHARGVLARAGVAP